MPILGLIRADFKLNIFLVQNDKIFQFIFDRDYKAFTLINKDLAFGISWHSSFWNY